MTKNVIAKDPDGYQQLSEASGLAWPGLKKSNIRTRDSESSCVVLRSTLTHWYSKSKKGLPADAG